MKKKSTLKAVVALAVIAFSAAALGGCTGVGVEHPATVAEAMRTQLGPDTGPIVHYPGLSSVKDSKPAEWTTVQYRQVQELWGNGCVAELQPQLKGVKPKSIAKTTVEGAVAGGLGLATGVEIAFAGANFGDYFTGGFFANGGYLLPYANDRHQLNVRQMSSQCLDKQIYWAQERDGVLDGIGVLTNYDTIDTNAVPVPPDADVPTAQERTRVEEYARTHHPPWASSSP